jgi:hypothetical protein
VKARTEFSWLMMGAVEGSCEHGKKQATQCIFAFLRNCLLQWWHLIPFCMVWFGRSVSHREPNKLLHFAATLTTFNATSQRPDAIFSLPSHRFILSRSLHQFALHSQAMSALMTKTSITLPDTGVEACKIAEGSTRNQTLPLTRECVIQSQTSTLF